MNANDQLYSFFKGFDKKPDPKPLSTTDTPDIKLFMFQILNHYSDMAGRDGMAWERDFNDKKTGKRYKVKITLCETTDR